MQAALAHSFVSRFNKGQLRKPLESEVGLRRLVVENNVQK
jgi:hypothetical protein